MKLTKYFFSIVLILFVSCNSKTKKETTVDIGYNDDLIIGEPKICFIKLNNTPKDDTLIFSKNDIKYHTLYVNIFDLDKNHLEIKKIECDSFYNDTKRIKEHLKTKFFLKPKVKGKKMIAGFIEQDLLLSAYGEDSTDARMISTRFHFKQEVFIKDSVE